MKDIGIYKVVAARRVRLPREAREHLGVPLAGKGLKVAVSMTDKVIMVAPAGVSLTGTISFGDRALYENADTVWLSIPAAARTHFRLTIGSSVQIHTLKMAEWGVNVPVLHIKPVDTEPKNER